MSDEVKKQKVEPKAPVEKSVERAKPARGEVDLFWLEKVFKTPADVFALKCPSPTELAQTCLFAFDTNALLGPFNVGADSVKNLEEIYKPLAKLNRIYAPAQAVREYAKNRARKVADVYAQVYKKLSNLPAATRLVCPMLEGNTAYEESNRLADELKERLKAYKDQLGRLKSELADWGWGDRVSNLYREIFTSERIVDHDKSEDEIRQDLDRRTTHKIPPGYKDAGKSDEGVGDLLIWHSLTKLAKDRKLPVVFICNEEKADWLVRSNDEILMPRPELTAEFLAETGQHFWLMNWVRFLEEMGAKPMTVHEAELTRAVDLVVLGDLEERISDQLEIITDTLNEFRAEWVAEPEDTYYSGPDFIQDERLPRFIRVFRTLAADYARLIAKPDGTKTLNRISAVLKDIESQNELLRYLEGTDKKAHGHRFRLFRDMDEFDRLKEMFNVWIRTNSVADDDR